MNIYDCFMYYDEDLLLDIRFNTLNKYVKKFIITEATYTHNGSKKKLNFDINNFKKFKDKIEYIPVDEQPPNIKILSENDTPKEKEEKLILNGMARDYFQREKLNEGLKNLKDDDLVIVIDNRFISERVNQIQNWNMRFIHGASCIQSIFCITQFLYSQGRQ